MTDAATECLPPDPDVEGLWWVRNDEMLREFGPITGNEVWRWDASGGWSGVPNVVSSGSDDNLTATEAGKVGWRVIARAVPPEDAA